MRSQLILSHVDIFIVFNSEQNHFPIKEKKTL